MKKFVLMNLLLYTFASFSQVRTTGGGGPDSGIDIFDRRTNIQDVWQAIDKIVFPKIFKGTSIQNKFIVLEYKILSLEKKCGLRNEIKWNHSLMDSYQNTKLKLLMTSFKDQLCPEESKEVCLKDKELKSILKLIKEDPQTYQYMKKKFDLDETSSKEILQFFEGKQE